MEKEIKISEKHLDQIIDSCARTMVCRVMKRFELFNNIGVIKKEVKELIYENSRTIKELINTFSDGLKYQSVKFVSNKQERK